MKKNYEINMCEGPLLPKLVLFALPLMLSSILQLLYNAADVIVVGKFAGTTALAAVSSTGSLTNLTINFFMGLSIGANVTVARLLGAKDREGASAAVHTSMLLAVLSGIFVAFVGFFGARTFLTWMGSPADVIDQATLYLKIYFLGVPASMVYNFGSSILRSIGDTKRPLIFLSISGILNVILNLVLVICFHLDVAGVAIATIFSQFVSAVFVVLFMMRAKGSAVFLDPKKLRFHKPQLLLILRTGIPAGIQSSVFAISNVLIQSSINFFGSTAMAGNGASSNLEGFVYVAMNAFCQAAQTFTSQNLGAKKPDRIRHILIDCLILVTAIGLGLGLILYFFGPQLIGIYDDNPEVAVYGMMRLSIIAFTYFTCGTMDTMCGQMRGLGYSVIPTFVSLIGACGLRVLWIYTIFQKEHTLTCLYISYPVSWILTTAAYFICYAIVIKKVRRRLTEA